MAKKQTLDASYLEWANDLPEELRGPAVEKFLSSAAAERIANLHKGMSDAQRRTNELEAREQRYGELDRWATQHSDLYQRLPEWAPLIRSHTPDDVERALTGVKREIEQQAAKVGADYEAGTITYEQALPMVVDLHKKYGTLNGQMEEFRQFREQDVPALVAEVRENLKRITDRQDNSNRSLIEFAADIADYRVNHPDRTARKIAETFIERNKDRQYKTFDDIAHDAYGDVDTEQFVERQVAERLKAQHNEHPPAGNKAEAPVTGSAIGPWRRQAIPVKPPPATTEGGMRTNLLEFFQKAS